MVKIFKKQGSKKALPDDGKAQLADASRRLGFEVGYHRHSEIGWVQEKLTQLYSFAEEYDLRDFVKENYNFGKEEGARNKDRDTKSGLSKAAPAEKIKAPPEITIERPKQDNSSRVKSGYKSPSIEIASSSGMILQPDMVELPENIERTRSIERPSFLDGARHLTPKKRQR